MTENEQKLTEQNTALRAQLEEAHELIAKSTYKLGVLAAFTGVAPEATHLQITASLRAVQVIRKDELANLRHKAAPSDV